MSKVSMSSRPEPGYENMDHFSINVDYVAEMLRTIEFQTGASPGTSAATREVEACGAALGWADRYPRVRLHPLRHSSACVPCPFLACHVPCQGQAFMLG